MAHITSSHIPLTRLRFMPTFNWRQAGERSQSVCVPQKKKQEFWKQLAVFARI